MRERTIAIIGGGPAGATAAETLAHGWGLRDGGGRGRRVLVLEEKMGWEKPCGGGLTHKALRQYPFLALAASGGNALRELEFVASTGTVMHVHLRMPLVVYSRSTLNQLLLRRAGDAGAEVIADRVLHLRRKDHGWEIEGRGRTYRADMVVLAAGARTRLRQIFVNDISPRDFMLTFGYYLSVPCGMLRVRFYEKFEGYAWAFPRPNHVSVGICGKVGATSMAAMQARLSSFMRESGYAPDPAQVFSHLLPSLSTESWGNLQLCGQGWALVGDAAGLVDPVTGEGIYYAMRSGELLGRALLEDAPQLYPQRVRDDFGRALATGARLARLFYHGELLGGGITTRMIECGARSGKIREIVQDLMDGTHSYSGLMARLQTTLARTLLETGVGYLREVAGAGRDSLETNQL